MISRWRLVSVAMLMLAVLLFTGCRYSAQSTNPKVVFAATLYDADVALDDLSISLRAANDGVQKLSATEPEYYSSVHPYLVKIAQANDKAVAAIQATRNGSTTADWQGAMVAIVTVASTMDPTTFGFKNPTSQASVKLLFASFNAAVAAIKASFGKPATAWKRMRIGEPGQCLVSSHGIPKWGACDPEPPVYYGAAGAAAVLNLITILIGLFGQYGPQLVKGVTDLIHGNPQAPGETDDAYIARLGDLAAAKEADTKANDAAVETP